ncbi:MAG TPA: HEAT repeat domain-containing protein [Bryobacteraceae bacterium]|nr:HEAT repeat domain-containing protein [Bryobacteraceae bacterium]
MNDPTCDKAKSLMAAAWTPGELDEAQIAWLRMHLAGCAECSEEMATLGSMWQRLGDLPVPEPSPALRRRWEQTLDALTVPQYAPARPAPAAGPAWWRNFWPANAAWQMAIAALCLAAGLSAGLSLQRGNAERDEVARLREEVANTKEMVVLSMLQQQSAADRLRGVDYSARMPSMEPQVVSALVRAVNLDPNVNVRLAAIDALGKVANDSSVRQSLQEALPQEDSPMVQAALIDYLMEAHDRNAVGTIQNLLAKPGVNPTVRERGTYAMQRLSQ